MEVSKPAPYSHCDISIHVRTDIGSNNSGFYELLAVLTHKGRSSSSGHYLGWVKHVSGNLFQFLLCIDVLGCYVHAHIPPLI